MILYTTAAALAIGGFAGWKARDWKAGADERDRITVTVVSQQKAARNTFRLQEARDAENLRTSDQLADALQRLRNRPARQDAASATSCSGSTGAQLSGEDAGFLSREAARADRVRADLATCEGWIREVSR